MELLLLFAFISGLVTILAPCIWPLLPIILSSSIGGTSHKRPLGITLGIMLSFAAFTLTISWLVMLFHFDPNILRLFAVIVIGFLGLTMVIPSLTRVVELIVSRLSGMFGQTSQAKGNDFGGGFVTGLSLGIVWSPCAGPILAAIATLAATSQISAQLVLITIAYVTGVGIPLFIFAYGGQRIVTNTRFISRYTGRVQQVFGVIMILTAVAIYTNYDKIIQAKLLDFFPQYSQALTQFESNEKVKQQLDILRGKKTMKDIMPGSNLPNLGQAPEFVGIEKWLNSEPLTLQSLRGKVVLIDFWTYTCINCIRTLPYVTRWYDTYKNNGLVVVGVHTPEFEFEKKTENVEQAIKQYNIHYPVAQDNNYATWDAYRNQYWPAKYLIDKDGNIRYTHFGEGQYKETEEAIRTLLSETGSKVSKSSLNILDKTSTGFRTPEIYLGSKRAEYFFPDSNLENGTKTYTLQKGISPNTFSLGGQWMISSEYAQAGKGGVLELSFTASKVFLVMRPIKADTEARVKVLLDGKVVNQGEVKEGFVVVKTDRLYTLIDLGDKNENHILRLEFPEDGIECYAFTFG